jgi:hypothetical protein
MGDVPRKIIKAQVCALTLDELLTETRRWLDQYQTSRPAGHTPGSWRDQRESIGHAMNRTRAARESGLSEADVSIARHKATMREFCINMRRRHGGSKPTKKRP